MNVVKLLPVIVSMLLLAAHFYRAGQEVMVFFSIALPLILLIRRPWVVRVMQAVLVMGALEWTRTVIRLAQMRMEMGAPWGRLALILSVVAVFTTGSTFVFTARSLRKRYRINKGIGQ